MNDQTNAALTWPVRVYLEDTDAGGVVYHARYLAFFERARSELLRACGIEHEELRREHGLIWVVTSMDIRWVKAAILGDELEALAAIAWKKRVSCGFHQELRRPSDGALIATAEVTAAILDKDTLKPVRMPEWLTLELKK